MNARHIAMGIGAAVIVAASVVAFSTVFNQKWWLKKVQAAYFDTFKPWVVNATISELRELLTTGKLAHEGTTYTFRPRT